MKLQSKRIFWLLLLGLDIILFMFAVLYHNVPSLVLVMCFAALIEIKGNEPLFGEFDRRRHAKMAEWVNEHQRSNKEGK